MTAGCRVIVFADNSFPLRLRYINLSILSDISFGRDYYRGVRDIGIFGFLAKALRDYIIVVRVD